ncbi:MAG TPA: DUF2382 domain-containing protein [Bryobacteraceae bacterium]|nr:DUF2382 domain-containing protein [Bryobacteraceae bacterium]
MPEDNPSDRDVVIPVVQEQVHVDAKPVITGGVRVTKHVESHDELIQQQLRTGHADIKRVQTNRIVDGPQPAQRVGNTLIIPVVSEILRVEKQWVVTEEIHITQREELRTVEQTVPVNYERAEVERLDETGTVTQKEKQQAGEARAAHSLLTPAAGVNSASSAKLPLSEEHSILKGRRPPVRKR